jgi:hypothetical protein
LREWERGPVYLSRKGVGLSRTSIRLWFCLAVAAISAAIADPLVEWASNAGGFGPGNFTDHSTADVVPALLVGVLFVATHLWLRVRRALTRGPAHDLLRASRQAIGGRVLRLLPLIFAVQMLALYCMETSEQIAVIGHPLGGTIWLGGPLLASLAVHAVACVLVAFAASNVLRALTQSAVRAVLFILAMAVRPARGVAPSELGRLWTRPSHIAFFVLCNVGERAPPLLTA